MTYIPSSGSIGYHLKALRYRKSNWTPFRAQITEWLSTLPISSKDLILVGPSAGYTLPTEWIRRFSRITVLEPDTIAKLILACKLGPSHALRTEWRDGGDFHPIQRFKNTLHRHPDAFVLFSNVLGQNPFLKHPLPISAILAHLANRPWASYHDRFSSTLEPTLSETTFPKPLSDEEILSMFYNPTAESTSLYDHETSGLFGSNTARYFSWQIRPGYFHLIEGVYHPN